MSEDLAALLEKLQALDPSAYLSWVRCYGLEAITKLSTAEMDGLQGGVQRAISARELVWNVGNDISGDGWIADISELSESCIEDRVTLHNRAIKRGPSACHALLACYIACLESQA